MTTYALGVKFGGPTQNIYTIFGDSESSMILPPAYQEPAPFGVNTGGVNPAFISAAPNAAFDSWLTVGITEGDTSGALGSVGIDFAGWNDALGITVDNGAVFWMTPGDGPAGQAIVACITTATGALDATINAQGRSTTAGEDWQARGI